MATWIGHLRIAEALLSRIPGLDAGQFALGSVAPDSGIPDEKREKFDPPTTVTHFRPADASGEREYADLVFHAGYLAGLDIEGEPLRFSFRLGYFFHLITDNLWDRRIIRPIQARHPDEFAADPNFIWTVKNDWYGLDFLYVRSHPDCLYWKTFLGATPLASDLEFLPMEAVLQQLDYIKSYYQRTDEKIEAMIRAPHLYLPRAEMDRFVDETAGDLYRIYRTMWEAGFDPPAHGSALSLLV